MYFYLGHELFEDDVSAIEGIEIPRVLCECGHYFRGVSHIGAVLPGVYEGHIDRAPKEINGVPPWMQCDGLIIRNDIFSDHAVMTGFAEVRCKTITGATPDPVSELITNPYFVVETAAPGARGTSSISLYTDEENILKGEYYMRVPLESISKLEINQVSLPVPVITDEYGGIAFKSEIQTRMTLEVDLTLLGRSAVL